MRSLFSRFKPHSTTSSSSNTSSRPASSTSTRDKENQPDLHRATIQKKHGDATSASITPLRSPTPLASASASANASSASSSVEAGRSQDSYIPDCDAVDMDQTPEMHDMAVGMRGRKMSSSGEGKKVTFRSPVPTPTTSVVIDGLLPPQRPVFDTDFAYTNTGKEQEPERRSPSPTKKALSFFHKRPNPPSRSSTTQAQSQTQSTRPPTLRKSSLPPVALSSSPTKSMLSPTASEVSLGGRSYLPPPNSWSEMAEDDLIANLGPKERTRQEVLWEIVSSEERYVNELIKLNNTFCRALLPPSAQSPSLNLLNPGDTLSHTLARTLSTELPPSTPTSPDTANLPIAAQYATSSSYSAGLSLGMRSPSGASSSTSQSHRQEDHSATQVAAARRNAYNTLTNGRPTQAPSHKASMNTLSKGRSHHSLPPLPRNTQQPTQTSFSASYARMSYQPKLKGDKRASSSSTATTKEVPLPEDLEKVLAVLAGGILEGHLKLVAALKRRYENQYPLVRSLADVFTAHSSILRGYATYVLHLERALAIVDETLSLLPSNTTQTMSKRLSKRMDDSPSLRLSYLLHQLEDLAAERGESGLVISLSKPFQRLLKYPLLFQNLLFNTDPSLKEYEATLAMVDEVEMIVRTIEDEKSDSEEREKTRDVWARIEGLEKDKMLMTPKSNRLLVSETPMLRLEEVELDGKRKKSFKRLSDILTRAEHQDLWIVRFTDVSLLCEKTGSTSLPIHHPRAASRSDSLIDLNDGEKTRSKKYAASGRRTQPIRMRNLYRFVKVHEWNLKQNSGSREGLLDMGDISESRRDMASVNTTTNAGINENGGTSTGDSKIINAQGTLRVEAEVDTALRLSSTMKPLPNSPGRDDRTTTKVPLKTNDGPSETPRKMPDPDSETVISDRLSVMSFAFKGCDQVVPARKARPSLKIATDRNANPSATGVRLGRLPARGPSTIDAHAKFAHRLRSPEPSSLDPNRVNTRQKDRVDSFDDAETDTDAEKTIRPITKSGRSLPPAMALKPITNVPDNISRNNDNALLNPARTSQLGSMRTSGSNGVNGMRGIKGSTPPGYGYGYGNGTGGAAEGKKVSAATAKRLSLKAEMGGIENGAAGLVGVLRRGGSKGNEGRREVEVGDGNRVERERSEKIGTVAGLAGRDLGGRI